MNESAVSQISVNPRSRLALIAVFAMAATLFAGLVSSAAAGPVGSDGKIYACYKVKGKPKGAMRIIPKAKARCKRGERKVGLVAVGASGQPAVTATPGETGSSGSAGSSGASGGSTDSTDSNFQAKVSSLNLKVDGLEDILDGVTEEDLTDAVDALDLVGELCDQTSALTSQANALEGVIDDLGLNTALDLLGGLIEVPELPGALDPFACAATP